MKKKNLNILFPTLSAVLQSFSALSSEHHRMATVTHKLQKVHLPCKLTDTLYHISELSHIPFADQLSTSGCGYTRPVICS